MQDLGTLGGRRSVAYDNNNLGVIVGESQIPEAGDGGGTHAFLQRGLGSLMQDLGTIGGGVQGQSSAHGINDSGIVVGRATTSNSFNHAFLYSGGQMHDLGTLIGPQSHSGALGINASGQVVGWSESATVTNSSLERHAFLYSGGQMHDLNNLIPADSGLKLIQANAINNSGQIVGLAIINGINGNSSAAFLVTPQPVDSASSEVAAGGTLSTATGDGTASSTDPVNTTITSPVGGAVSITETSTTQQAPSGFTFFGEQVNIEAPEATVQNPLVLKFVLDASLLPEGQDPNTIELFRNGTLAGECADASGAASPDPCVSKREALASGDVAITVLTSHASAWNFAAPSYEFAGFYSPVDNLPTLNKAKAGSAIPVKFSLGGDMGFNVFAKDQSGSYPKSGSIACEPNANADTIEQTVNAGSSSLSYDASTGRYTYVWKTDKTWQNSCRQMMLKFKDGTEHAVAFQFTK
jgi:probable HAF family extracellular repeat protein